MSRAHLNRPVLDPAGNVITNVTVHVYEPGTSTPIAESIYLNSTTATATVPPLTFATGVINFYLESPKRVRLGVASQGGTEVFYDDIDVTTPGGAPVLWVSTAAAGPPTDGSRFWYVTDEIC